MVEGVDVESYRRAVAVIRKPRPLYDDIELCAEKLVPFKLTLKEQAVLRVIASGVGPYGAIAEQLGIRVNTLRGRLPRIRRKLGTVNVTHTAYFLWANGMVKSNNDR